ncbi:MAG: hypothetical protein MZW92_66130 [Comamonadaceae bacterium]|nr:hypothetical protein [Comamonadaceae bacterium]
MELDTRHVPAEVPNPLASSFTFDGVSIRTRVRHRRRPADHERGCVYALSLRVIVDNEPNPEAKNQRYAPCLALDVAVDGLVFGPGRRRTTGASARHWRP